MGTEFAALPTEARPLAERMSAQCQRAWGRPWVDHLEYVLWYATVNGPMRYGAAELEAGELAELAQAARDAQLWITRDRDGAFRALSLRDWQDRFTANVEILTPD